MCVSASSRACPSSMSVGLIDLVRAVLAYEAVTFVRHAMACLLTLAMHHLSFVCLLRRKEGRFFTRGGSTIKDPKRDVY